MDTMSKTNRTIEAIFIDTYDSNYSEFPDSWCELFDNLEYVILSETTHSETVQNREVVNRGRMGDTTRILNVYASFKNF